MSPQIGNMTAAEWDALLRGLSDEWNSLVSQARALRDLQKMEFDKLLSNNTLSKFEADAILNEFIAATTNEDADSRYHGSLDDFVYDKDGPENLPSPAFVEIEELITTLIDEWEKMFSKLEFELPSIRNRTLLDERRKRGSLPLPASLSSATLMPSDDLARLHDQNVPGEVISIGLGKLIGEIEPVETTEETGEPNPSLPQSSAAIIEALLQQHLRLTQEITKLGAFWTEGKLSLAQSSGSRPRINTARLDQTSEEKKQLSLQNEPDSLKKFTRNKSRTIGGVFGSALSRIGINFGKRNFQQSGRETPDGESQGQATTAPASPRSVGGLLLNTMHTLRSAFQPSMRSVWLEPFPDYAPVDRNLLKHLRQRRKEADQDAVLLKQADDALSSRTSQIEDQLKLQNVTLIKHPVPAFDPESVGASDFLKIREFLDEKFDNLISTAENSLSTAAQAVSAIPSH